MRLTEGQWKLLRGIAAWWPDPITIKRATYDFTILRDSGLIVHWDTLQNGNHRWVLTREGRRAALAQSVEKK